MGKLLFTVLLISYPILSIYGFLDTPLTIADFLLVIFILVALIENRKFLLSYYFLPYFLYILLQLLFVLLFRNSINSYDTTGTALRYLLYFIAIIFFANKFFEINLGIRYYKYCCRFVTVYLIVQMFSYNILGVYIPGTIKTEIFPIISGAIRSQETRIAFNLVTVYRPYSMFSEPAHYSQFILGYLALSIFNQGKKETIFQIFLSLGLLLSTSTTGGVCCIGLWGIWFLHKHKEKIAVINLLSVIAAVLVIILIISRIAAFQIFITRLLWGSSVENHFNGYFMIADAMKNDFWGLLFGQGMQRADEYLTGIGRVFFYFGLLGVVVFLLCIIKLFRKISFRQKMTLLVFLILSVGTELLFQPMIFVYLPFLVLKINDDIMVQKQHRRKIFKVIF